MNGVGAEALTLAMAVRDGAEGLGCDLLVCPPATVLSRVAAALAGGPVMVGGQDCHAEPSGPHTGDVSAAMLREAGAGWVIVGHSERRADHDESDTLVRRKAVAAAASGLVPIICVGETEPQRLTGNAELIVAAQVNGSVPPGFAGVVAYEPVWAIGTGRTPTEADVAEMHRVIREQLVSCMGPAGLGIRILYGGSVKPGNAAGLLRVSGVGGALVGGASLVAADFLAIARAVSG